MNKRLEYTLSPSAAHRPVRPLLLAAECGASLRRLGAAAGALWIGGVALAGCAQLGVPEAPVELRGHAPLEGELFLVYDPWAVLGFGHSGLIVADAAGGGYLRYDQYASSEIRYERRAAAGVAGFWEGFLERLPPLAGFTRGDVTRLAAPEATELVGPRELAIPIPAEGGGPGAVYAAAEARHRSASVLEAPAARRYYLFSNNCQHFVRDLLVAGGLPDPSYFPKWYAERLLARYRSAAHAR